MLGKAEMICLCA